MGPVTDDDGSYDRPAWVFGGTAAAILLRREALDDVAYPGNEFLAESFFAYREDAELAWRLQLRGWRCLYVPSAVGGPPSRLPARGGTTRPRDDQPILGAQPLPAARATVRTSGGTCAASRGGLLRDLLVVGACLTVERASLPALVDVWRLRSDSSRRGRWVLGRRTVPPRQIARWFRRRGRVEEVEGREDRDHRYPRGACELRRLRDLRRGAGGASGRPRSRGDGLRPARIYRPAARRATGGCGLVVLPALRSKHLETVSHTFVAALHAARRGFDVGPDVQRRQRALRPHPAAGRHSGGPQRRRSRTQAPQVGRRRPQPTTASANGSPPACRMR